jgi:hypothetical protein
LFAGFRVIGQALIPRTASSLVYGSADAGNTIAENEKIREILFENLTHQTECISDVKGAWHTLSSCVDCEVHQCKDSRLYLLDVARMLPPAAPFNGNAYLFRLFRPEFVAICPQR